jgi:uncharacterized iron-regulated protein
LKEPCAASEVKLPAHRAGLPGRVRSITRSAFLPAYKAGHPADFPVKFLPSETKCYNFTMRQLLLIFLIVIGTLLLSGCVKKVPPPVWVAKIQSVSSPLGPEEIFSLPEGEKVSLSELLRNVEGARVLFVGETHDQLDHHRIQLTLIQELLRKRKSVVVAMEMFKRLQQPTLDRWSEGLLTESQFLKEVDWEKTWSMDYGLYKGILDESQKNHLKVLGLNVPRELVRRVAEVGIDGLSPEDRAKVPDMDLSDMNYRKHLASVYRGHKEGSAKGFERFYEAQCLWDEGMAETLSSFLASPEGQGKTVVVIVGKGHIVFNFGIPKRVYRRTPLPFRTIVLKEWEKDLGDDKDLTSDSGRQPPGDYLWITQPNPPEKKRPRIGVILSTESSGQEGLEIERVIPGSPAEKAGLLPGDRLKAVEGKDIRALREIHEALAEKGWGKEITLTILRDGIKKEITVTLPTAPD